MTMQYSCAELPSAWVICGSVTPPQETQEWRPFSLGGLRSALLGGIPLSDRTYLYPQEGLLTYWYTAEDGWFTAHFVPAIGDIPIGAPSLRELNSAVADLLASLWSRYVEAPDDSLLPRAAKRKKRLLEHYRVFPL